MQRSEFQRLSFYFLNNVVQLVQSLKTVAFGTLSRKRIYQYLCKEKKTLNDQRSTLKSFVKKQERLGNILLHLKCCSFFFFFRVLKPVHLSLYEMAEASRSVVTVVVARSGEGNILLPLPSLRRKLPEEIQLNHILLPEFSILLVSAKSLMLLCFQEVGDSRKLCPFPVEADNDVVVFISKQLLLFSWKTKQIRSTSFVVTFYPLGNHRVYIRILKKWCKKGLILNSKNQIFFHT